MFSCDALGLSGLYNPSSPSSIGFTEFSLIFGCGFLHLFLSVVGWSLSDGDYARLLSMSIAEYH